MIGMREHLARQLAAELDRHRIVVWMDPPGEYRDVAADLVPERAAFERFDGSWYALRRRIEPALVGAEPRLVVYVDAEPPKEPSGDPLAELRACGTEFRTPLVTLLHKVLASELTSARIDDIAAAAATLTEAETLAGGDGSGGPPRLVKALNLHEPTEIVLALATGKQRLLAEHPELFDEVRAFLHRQLGADPKSATDVSASLARHLVLTELAELLSALPESLDRALPPTTGDQRRRCRSVLHRWRHDQSERAAFIEAMWQADADLGLAAELEWHDALADIDTVPAYEDLAFTEYARRLEQAAYERAETLAAARRRSLWAVPEGRQEWDLRWRLAHVLAQLLRLLADNRQHAARTVADRLRHYADVEWKIDQAHRRLELALLGLVARDALETPVQEARRAYNRWLDGSLREFTAAADAEGLVTDLLLQGQIHDQVVRPRAARCRVAYVMVDALRYELGQELATALRRQFDRGTVDLEPAVGLLPSITPVGMANLCPGAERGLELALDTADRLVVRIDGQEIMTPVQRMARLQAAHGNVADLRLDDIVRLSEQELAAQLGSANLVLVRSQEIDEQGETGKLNLGLHGFDATVQQLSRAIARLANHGVMQFVISADHGFLALSREVGPHMVIPKPGGRGEVHRRAFVGRGGSTDDALLRLPLEKVGLPGDLDVIVPRGLALIAAGGARGFFHGGLSPQEIVVPVLTVDVQPAQGTVVLVVEVTIAPKITSQIFTAKMLLQYNLLSKPLTVRPVPTCISDGRTAGVLVTAGGAEQGEGLVRLVPGEEVSLGFRVTTTLAKGDKVELDVLDARTDRRLARSARAATVARKLEIDDELL